jgi:hypothetical protein
MLDKKYLRRKFIDWCDVFIPEPMEPGTFNGTIEGQYCREPARYYKPGEVGMFGAYLCDEHAEKWLDKASSPE